MQQFQNMKTHTLKPIVKDYNEFILCYFLFYINNVYQLLAFFFFFGIMFIKI